MVQVMSPRERIVAYFEACTSGTADGIAAHFTQDAVVYDTNVRPVHGNAAIGTMWVKVRERWRGARWTVDSFVGEGDAAAIEWSMVGTDPTSGRTFTFHGSEHYALRDGLIAEIRQYWTFDPVLLDTGLLGYRH